MTTPLDIQDRKQDDLELIPETIADLEAENAEAIRGGLLPTSLHNTTFNPSGG
jgi:hypothetical protein